MDDPSTAGTEGFGLARYREASLWDKACSLRYTPRVLREGEIRGQN